MSTNCGLEECICFGCHYDEEHECALMMDEWERAFALEADEEVEEEVKEEEEEVEGQEEEVEGQEEEVEGQEEEVEGEEKEEVEGKKE